jgi:protein-S-isoprenylcysteine O-methyltransferase Ste14
MTEFLPELVFVVVVLGWFSFAVVVVVHKKPAAGPERKRDHASIVGLFLQCAAYATLWIVHREYFSPVAAMSQPLEIAMAFLTIVLAIGSILFVWTAIKALGKQWSIGARVVEGHQLVTNGPYGVVRNPIYTGMLGMLLATGLAVSNWLGLMVAIVVFAIGTWIRVRSEEKLLREAFGTEFDEYAHRVPAVVPFVRF